METKVMVQSCTEKNGWYNIKTPDGKEISVMIEKCPNIKEAISKELEAGTIGEFPVEMNLIEKNGKTYGWDIKAKGSGGGGFKKERSGNESFALSYSKDLVVAGKVEISKILETAEKLYQWLETKKK
jgi:hypothetical protein